ncbi:MAG: hypothetical protein MJ097_02290 [Dorea sp.]|nr:hypothetical protein [Dorea sp.]
MIEFKDKIDQLLHRMDPEQIGRAITRYESDDAGENRFLYRKGAKSMLEVFTDDYDFIEKAMAAFDRVYEEGSNEE